MQRKATTTITIPAHDIQEHLEDALRVDLTSFCLDSNDISFEWNHHRTDDVEIDYDMKVERDMEYEVELNEYVHVDFFDEQTNLLANTIAEQAELISKLTKELATIKKTPFWRFW